MRNNAFLNYLPNNKPRTGDQKLSDTFTTCGFPELTGSRRAGKLLTKLMGCVEDRGCSRGSFHRGFFSSGPVSSGALATTDVAGEMLLDALT